MENTLGLYKLIDGNAVKFPSVYNWAKLGDYKYSATRMGNVPSITATLIWPTCLDGLWNDDVFVEFRGEKYFLKDTPSSSRDNTKCTYSHNIEFVSERAILSEVYFFDVVKNNDSDIVSDNSEFSFSGDINVFAEKINASMTRSGIGTNDKGYYVVVDDGMTSESKLFQASGQFLYDALKAAYELYEIPFYFVGKDIHFGNYQTKIETPIEYGSKSSALSISKNNKNKRIVNRITGGGSDRNLKYYYPNPTPKGTLKLEGGASANYRIVDQLAFSNKIELEKPVMYSHGVVEILDAYPVGMEYDELKSANIVSLKGGETYTEYILNVSFKATNVPANASYKSVPLFLKLSTANANLSNRFIEGVLKTPVGDELQLSMTGVSASAGVWKYSFSHDELEPYYEVVGGTYTLSIKLGFKAEDETDTDVMFIPVDNKGYEGYMVVDEDQISDIRYSSSTTMAFAIDIRTPRIETSTGIVLLKNSFSNFSKPVNLSGYFISGDVLYDGERTGTVRYRYDGSIDCGVLEPGPYTVICRYSLPFPLTSNTIGISSSLSETGIWVYADSNIEVEDFSDAVRPIDGYSPKHGDILIQSILKRVNVQNNLMPSKYRDTDGSERFYDAVNNLYKDENGEYYEFSNPYTPVRPREYIYTDEEIYPSITRITNTSGQRIDMVAEVAFDKWDDNEIYPEDYKDQKLANTYKHPYFFVKLRKTDGENGFNLFDSAIDSETMKISFTSGHVASCEFEIGVDENTGKNPVQVDSDGNLVRDDDGNVVYRGVAQDKQQNTMMNEVWIALKKEESTMGVLMPDTKQFIQPTVDDTFVILGIDLPDAYVLAAEKRLERAILDYMHDNNSREFTYSVKLSSIYLAENELLYESLNENSMIGLVYDSNNEGDFFVDSYSYSVKQKAALPEISITLNNEIKLVVPKSKAVNDAIQNITTTSIKAVTETDNLKSRTQALEAKVSKMENVDVTEDINSIKANLEHIDERVSDLERSGGGGGAASINIESSGPAFIEVQNDGAGGYTISPNIILINEVDNTQDAHGIADSADVKEHLELLKEWVNNEVEFVMYTPSSDIIEDSLLVYDSSNSSVKSSGVKVSDDVRDIENEDNTKVPTCATISQFVEGFVDAAQTDIKNRVINGKGNIKTSSVWIVSGIIEDDAIVYALPSAPEQSLREADHVIATNKYVDNIVGDINTLLETIIVG